MHVVVAGGGLAGLVAAGRLAESGAEVELFEERPSVGGRVRSRVVDGYTLDRGFQVLSTAYPAARRELDLDALELRAFSPGATIARPNHRSTLADPLADPAAAVPTLLNRDVRTADKLRLLRLQRRLRRTSFEELSDDGMTIREYLAEEGFSRAFVEHFAEPFYGGITLDRDLVTAAFVFKYTFKALSEGRTVVPAAGMGAIADQLRERAEAAGVEIRTDTAVTTLETGEPPIVGTEAGERRPDAAVVATDPKTAGELAGVDVPTGAKGCVTVHVSLPAHRKLDTGSRILLNAAGAGPNTVAPMSAAAPEYAPEGSQLLSATFLGERPESDAELGRTVRETLASWYPEHRFDDLEVVGVDRVEFAQFPLAPGDRARLPDVGAPAGPVTLAGDFTEWSSIQGALRSGRRAAAAVRGTE